MTLDLKSGCGACASEGFGDGEGSVQVHQDPRSVRRANLRVSTRGAVVRQVNMLGRAPDGGDLVRSIVHAALIRALKYAQCRQYERSR